MKKKFTIMLLSITLALIPSDAVWAQSGNKGKSTACDLKSDMRKLWEDHIQWTRNVIFNILDDLPGTSQAVAGLLKNQDDIGNAIKPFYGEAAGNQLTALLHEHITIAAELLTALKNENTTAFNDANARWIANADAIAALLSSVNPNWPLEEIKKMMYEHLNLTAAEALARKNQDYNADVMAYDHVHLEILEMADFLTAGIVKQFPNRFTGCRLDEITKQEKTTPCDLKSAMRKLWEDHITWTRNVIFNILDNLPGTEQAVNRLLQNQVDIGNAIKPFYGAAAGDQLAALLHEHITLAADILTALKNNDATGLATANTKWYMNADAIARFLSSLNPFWPYQDLKTMMFTHLGLTTAEALARKTANYSGDVVAYDNVHLEILQMADMLTEGIVKQFANKFRGCPLATPRDVTSPVLLLQNIPNPFNDRTTITFIIPESIKKAQLIIYDDMGNVIKRISLSQRGRSFITLNTLTWRKGFYSYCILADGKITARNKMVH
jgi:hypothetical protein